MVAILIIGGIALLLFLLASFSQPGLIKGFFINITAGNLHVTFGIKDLLIVLITAIIVLTYLKIFKSKANGREKTFTTIEIVLLVEILIKIYPLLPGK